MDNCRVCNEPLSAHPPSLGADGLPYHHHVDGHGYVAPGQASVLARLRFWRQRVRAERRGYL